MAYVATAEQGIVWALDGDGNVWVLDIGEISIEEEIHNEDLGWDVVESEDLV